LWDWTSSGTLSGSPWLPNARAAFICHLATF
jgi:hypothetical protein